MFVRCACRITRDTERDKMHVHHNQAALCVERDTLPIAHGWQEKAWKRQAFRTQVASPVTKLALTHPPGEEWMDGGRFVTGHEYRGADRPRQVSPRLGLLLKVISMYLIGQRGFGR